MDTTWWNMMVSRLKQSVYGNLTYMLTANMSILSNFLRKIIIYFYWKMLWEWHLAWRVSKWSISFIHSFWSNRTNGSIITFVSGSSVTSISSYSVLCESATLLHEVDHWQASRPDTISLHLIVIHRWELTSTWLCWLTCIINGLVASDEIW